MEDRTESTITPLILRYIKAGSTVYTDEASIYVNNKSKESKLSEFNFAHFHVCHKYTFVHEFFPDVHTNQIESIWREIKDYIRVRHATSSYKNMIA